ncbi:zf-HC2 domain-containing protein [Duganella aceris]|uniref:Zf-HC2 domain-containing protein n=1 Tax=Duganella aceris TaxID=2703883 RepID=A0ABX0FQY4_9BURK|nr:zf-HC2 domain-containing protein [Duganella aceris]NGZ87063.1 zf-HC2 domain-containing protein [Duganella aceris]
MKPEIVPISCRETTYLVSESRDAALDDEQSARLAAHLDTCDACRIASTQFAQLFAHLETLLARQHR